MINFQIGLNVLIQGMENLINAIREFFNQGKISLDKIVINTKKAADKGEQTEDTAEIRRMFAGLGAEIGGAANAMFPNGAPRPGIRPGRIPLGFEGP